MPTINTIIEEIKEVPVNRLEDLYSLIHSFNSTKITSNTNRKKILSFAGSFNDIPDSDYKDFTDNISNTRKALFSRNINL